jgi:hypothetical protein
MAVCEGKYFLSEDGEEGATVLEGNMPPLGKF